MRVIAPLVVLAALLATASPAAAATFTVTTTADSTNPCSGTSCPSIRSALAAAEAAGGADTVIVPAGNYQLSQAGALLVDSDVTLRGASARTTTVVAGLGARVFEVGTSVSVTISQVTASGGTGASGGNVLNQGALTLDHVRVTGGNATGAGGSGVANESGSLTVRNSLIDANRGSGQGGGILSTGTTLAPARLTVTDSTVYDNNAGATGGGIEITGAQPFRVQASIVARNTDDTGPNNCTVPLTSDGANVEDLATCGFTAAGDAQGTDPQISPAPVNAGGQTDVLTIPATSPARDRAPGCAGADQRDLGRPQGAACDAGAYELDQPPETALSAAATTTPGASPTFTFSSTEPGVRFECRLDGAVFSACTSPAAFADLPEGAHTFDVRAVDGAGTPDATPASNQFTVRPKARFRERVVIGLVSGIARYKLKGTSQFLPLSGSVSIPLGSKVDVKRGRIGLTSEPAPGAPTERIEFYDGVFKVSQPGAVTQLKLTERLRRCPRRGSATAARRPKARRLWGSGAGRFRTRGRYSAATVSGTEWLVKDSCRGTLTKVREGTVRVRDKLRRKTIVLEAGERSLARPRRRWAARSPATTHIASSALPSSVLNGAGVRQPRSTISGGLRNSPIFSLRTGHSQAMPSAYVSSSRCTHSEAAARRTGPAARRPRAARSATAVGPNQPAKLWLTQRWWSRRRTPSRRATERSKSGRWPQSRQRAASGSD